MNLICFNKLFLNFFLHDLKTLFFLKIIQFKFFYLKNHIKFAH